MPIADTSLLIQVKVSNEIDLYMKNYCKVFGVSKSEFVRNAIIHEVLASGSVEGFRCLKDEEESTQDT